MYWNKPVETMARDDLRALQLPRLQETVERVYAGCEYYRSRMQEMHVAPDDIKTLDDIRRLPFVQKTDLRDNYPYGLFAGSRDEIVRVHASSGTTGKPIVAGYTRHDIGVWSEVVARCLGCAHIDRTDTVQVSYGYGLFTGGLGLHYGAEYCGAQVVPTGSGNTQRQLMLMEDLGVTALACTPSYALLLGETLRDMGKDRSKLKLKRGVFGAEPWTDGMRDQIEELLGIDALDIYGLTEISGPGVAMECLEARKGLHMWEDHFLFEILDPDSGEPLPDGETGELVISTITKEGMPILRYRTHDLTSVIPEPCPCGRTHRRITRFKGRTDDMLIIRGVNVFPSQIESVLMGIPNIGPHYQIVLTRKDFLDAMEVQVELADGSLLEEYRGLEKLEKSIHDKLKAVLRLEAKVKLVEPRTLARFTGKAKRVVDNRT